MEDPNEEEEAAHLPTEASVKMFQQTDGTKTNTIQDCHEMKIENIESYETKYSETDTSTELTKTVQDESHQMPSDELTNQCNITQETCFLETSQFLDDSPSKPEEKTQSLDSLQIERLVTDVLDKVAENEPSKPTTDLEELAQRYSHLNQGESTNVEINDPIEEKPPFENDNTIVDDHSGMEPDSLEPSLDSWKDRPILNAAVVTESPQGGPGGAPPRRSYSCGSSQPLSMILEAATSVASPVAEVPPTAVVVGRKSGSVMLGVSPGGGGGGVGKSLTKPEQVEVLPSKSLMKPLSLKIDHHYHSPLISYDPTYSRTSSRLSQRLTETRSKSEMVHTRKLLI